MSGMLVDVLQRMNRPEHAKGDHPDANGDAQAAHIRDRELPDETQDADAQVTKRGRTLPSDMAIGTLSTIGVAGLDNIAAAIPAAQPAVTFIEGGVVSLVAAVAWFRYKRKAENAD